VCYRDLARLRGVQHMTWLDSGKMKRYDGDARYENNPRYWNYSFDPDEFRRLVLEAIRKVNSNFGKNVHKLLHGEL